jgi:plasmid stabilization system protein ParE
MKIAWARAATEGREAIVDYVFERNPLAALELDENIDHAVEQLEDFLHLWSPGRVPTLTESPCRIV